MSISQLFILPPSGTAENADCQLIIADLISKINTNFAATIAAGTTNRLAYYTSATAIGSLSAITASRALASDSNGLPVASTTTATELGYVNGVTSAIQTQFSGKASTALSNLASVAINTSLVSDTNNTDDLGSSSVRWANGYFGATVSVSSAFSGNTVAISAVNTSNTASSDGLVYTEVAGSSGGDARYRAQISGGVVWDWGLDNSDGDSWALSSGGTLGTNNAIRVTTAGEINQPLQPSFLVTLASDAVDVTGDGTAATVVFDTEVFDQGGDIASGVFTAPITGCYQLSAMVTILGVLTTHTELQLQIVTSNRTIQFRFNNAVAYARYTLPCISIITDMDANDTASVVVTVSNSTKVIDLDGGAAAITYFSGSLIN